MIASIIDGYWMRLSQITYVEQIAVTEAFSIQDPKARFYNSDTDGIICKYHEKSGLLSRGFLTALHKLCVKKGFPLEVVDTRTPCRYFPPSADIVTDAFLDGIVLEQYQLRALHAACDPSIEIGLFEFPTGSGKCLDPNTIVRMYDGSVKRADNVEVGDLLMGDDSSPRTVLSICNGIDDMYEISQKNGDSYVVNSNHILSLRRTPARKGMRDPRRVVDISLTDYINSSKTQKHLLKGYKVSVDYPERNINIDPYILGLWLGDGIAKDTRIMVCDGDIEIEQAIKTYALSIGCVVVVYKCEALCSEHAIRLYEGIHKPGYIGAFEPNKFKQVLLDYGIFGDKDIPIDYIVNSRDIRLQLLAGFIDADGHLNGQSNFDIAHRSGIVIEKIAEIARSLGFRVSINRDSKKSSQYHTGIYTRLTISGNLDQIPTKLKRKRANKRRIAKDPLSYGISVKKLDVGQYCGFKLDGNGRFLLGDFTVTHNSELIAGLVKLYNCPTVVIADQLIIIDQLAKRLMLRKVVEDVGLFMAGVRPNGQIVVVGSIQSLAIPSLPVKKDHDTDESYIKKLVAHETRTKNAKKLRDIIGKCDLCLIDEADKATSSQYQKLLRYWFKGRRRFGFSGTLFDPESPVENLKLRENLGEILATAERSEVQAQKRIIPVTYTALAIGNYKDRYNRVTYDVAEDESIAENVQLHKIIANIVSKQVAANPKAGILIIIDKIKVGTNLQSVIPGSVFLHGGTSKKARPKIIKDFEDRKINVLIGSKILRRGLDLSGGCEILINATGGKRWSEFVQLVGRAVRLNAAGICHIYDFYFLTNHYLYEHSRKRIKHIVGLGYAARVVFPHCAVDAVKFIASKFRIPKH